ncbi:hypothetical protein MMU07_07195 [Aquiflexum sp. LQ15W]|uniref:hypothetical protein n=1 Tax=Cognataquiflexum nitidum TaxID=2922272 RepID=UPI001F14898C|nr:hypothetical protein [Cognataquiflexum nitidum]MCH6199356.1 hypothetical protein [Cognataquiflexum nitidum]
MDDVVAFWEQEKLNWSRWKIFRLRIKFHNLTIWQFLKCYIKSLVSTKTQDLKINLLFLVIAAFLGLKFFQNEAIMTSVFVSLWFVFPVVFQSWIYHSGATLGEKSIIFKNKRYASAKRDSMWSVLLASFFLWQIILTKGREYLGLEGFFGITYFHPSISVSIIFMMLVSARAFYLVYKTQLKPFLYEVK